MDHVTHFKNYIQESPFTNQEFTISDVKKIIRFKYKSFRATFDSRCHESPGALVTLCLWRRVTKRAKAFVSHRGKYSSMSPSKPCDIRIMSPS